jgi:hypothetical protein
MQREFSARANPVCQVNRRSNARRIGDLFAQQAGQMVAPMVSPCWVSIGYRGPIDKVTFSGSVAEYIYDSEKNAYGDLGRMLASEIRARIATWDATLGRQRAFAPP